MKGVLISDFIAAYDAVIPGYAWAWHNANLYTPLNIRGRCTQGWHDKRRTLREGCITLYGFFLKESILVAHNRGYVDLFSCVFPDREQALSDLFLLRHSGTWDKENGENAMYHFTKDATPFEQRCHITVAVLQYVKEHATTITPLWQGQDLTRSS